MNSGVGAARRTRLTARLLNETCLTTSGSRLALAALLATGTLSTVLPASAVNVATEAELRNVLMSFQNNDTITFTANITLTDNLPPLSNNMTINGGNFTLSGNKQYRGLFVESGNVVTIKDLTIANALAQGGKGGDGRVQGGGGGGGAGLGGALFVAAGATVTVSNVSLLNNKAQGGNGGQLSTSSACCGGFSGGGGGYWTTGADGGRAGFFSSGGGGTPTGGDGSSTVTNGTNGGFGGGGGGGGYQGGAGGFGGGGGGSGNFDGKAVAQPGGFGGGSGAIVSGQWNWPGPGGGGGAGLGGAIFVQQGGTLNLDPAGSFNISGNIVAGGLAGSGAEAGKGFGSGIFLPGNGSLNLAPGAGQTWTISDAIVDVTGAGGTGADSGSWSLVKNGPGTMILTGANAYTGGTIVNAGILLGNSSSLPGNITNNANIIFDQASNGTYAGNMSGSGALFKRGDGELALTGTNTYAGGTRVEGGFLQIASDDKLGAAGTHIDFAGGGLHATGTFSSARHVTLFTGGGDFRVDAGQALTWSGVVEGGGTLVKSGDGELTLSNANSYTGGTTVTQGTLSFAHTNGAPNIVDALGSGAVTLNGGTLRNATGVSSSLTNNIVLGAGGGTIHDGGSGLFLDGTITGTGSLILQGSQIIRLSGAATHTGATTIESGVSLLLAGPGTPLAASTSAFRIASGGTFNLSGQNATIGSLADVAGAGGTVTNDAGLSSTLTIGNDNTSTSFSGTLQDGAGTLALTKVGAGTQTLSGANTYTGATTVNAGGLIVVNSIASSSGVTVNAGAMIGGTGTLPSTTIHGGTLSPGTPPGNPIGTITINGNLVFGAGSIYRVDVTRGTADLTFVNNSASLAGVVEVKFAPGAGTTNTYAILAAVGGRNGTFDAVQVVNPALSASLSYTSGSVELKLVSKVGQVITGTPNQEALAVAHDAAFNAGLPAVSELHGLSAAQLPAALDQLTGEVHASTAGVLVDESRYVRSGVLGRLRQASYGSDASLAALSLGGPQIAFADGELDPALAYGKTPLPVKAPLTAPTASRDIVFWAEGFGASGRFGSDGNAVTLRRDLAGFMSGVDTRVGSNGRAGIAAGYTASRNNLEGRGSANVETGHLAAYGGVGFGSFKLRGGGAFSWHTIDTDRTIAFPGFFDRATANYAGRTGQIFGEVGYGFAFGNVAVEPFAGAAWVHLATDAAAERATAAALNIGATTFETGYSTLGVRAASLIPIGNEMVLIPRASVAWQHAFNDVTPGTALAFQASGTGFVISGVPIARDALLAEAGLDLAIGRNATLGVSYVGQIAGNVQDHAAKGKFSWKF